MSKIRQVLVYENKVIDFVGLFPFYTTLSALLVIVSIILLLTKGVNLGVDFRGGAEIQIKFAQPTTIAELRQTLEENKINFSSVQNIGEDKEQEFLIKVSAEEKDINKSSDLVNQALMSKMANHQPEIRKTEIVGAKAGQQLRTAGIWAMIWSILGIMIYVGLRFDFKYAPGVVVSLLHDAIIVLGLFSFLGKEFNLQIVAAILALIGYSVNDTVVIYDRIREHEKLSQRLPINDLINKGLTETLGRSVITAGATFTVCFIMYLYGGDVIHNFFFALWTGIIVGTYSSLFVATPSVLLLYRYGTKREWGSRKHA